MNITVKNYKKFKPSEFVRSFVSDIEVAEEITKKTGERMNMCVFQPHRGCLPCLGGMACFNMLGHYPYTGEDYGDEELSRAVGSLGNSIRIGVWSDIESDLKMLYPKYKKTHSRAGLDFFNGETYQHDITRLKKQIHKIADIIERSGQ